MSLQQVPVGRDIPNDLNVIIEIPMNSPAIKYEVDKVSGAIFVDRMLNTAMHYPCNYGYVPHTICGDGDPVEPFRIGLEFGARHRQAGWGQGLTILSCMMNLLPHLGTEDRPRAVYHGLAAVSRDVAGMPIRFSVRPLPTSRVNDHHW